MSSRTFLEIGARFERLLVIKFAFSDKRKRTCYLCRCDCGKEKIIPSICLKSGSTRSCGCLRNEKTKERQTLPNNEAVKKRLMRNYRKGANKRKISFNLSRDEFFSFLEKACFYCGNAPSNDTEGFIYNGIDRLDNNSGYNMNNCVSCCYICNRKKCNFSKDEFLDWIEKVYKYSIEKCSAKD